MAVRWYNQGKLEVLDGTIAFGTANLYAILVSSSYTYSAAHTTYSDVSANEIGDADYSPVDIASATVALSGSDVVYDCEDITFGASVTIDASSGHLIVLQGDEAAPAAGDRLIFEFALGSGAASTNSEFTINTPNDLMVVS